MFIYFPKNYVWSMSTIIAATHGGSIGEIDEFCRPLLDKSSDDADVGTVEFLHAWIGGADKLIKMIYAELSGDFPLGDSRQPTYKSLRPFDLVS